MKKLILVLFCMYFVSACSPSDLPKYTSLQSLRVLALNVDAPEINFDGTTFTPNTINLMPWISDLYGAGRALSYNLEWCLDPGISFGAKPTCAGNPTRTLIAQAQAVALSATYLAPNYTGSLDPIAVNFATASASALALLGQSFLSATSAQQYNGISLILIYEVYPNSNLALKVSSFKRVIISSASKVTKNQNPSGLEIRQNGAEIGALPVVDSEMTAYLSSAEAENYNVKNSNGALLNKTESLDTTWFFTAPEDVKCANDKACTSDGSFKLSRTKFGEANLFFAPQTTLPITRGRILVAVTRDNRGGNVAKRYCFGTCP